MWLSGAKTQVEDYGLLIIRHIQPEVGLLSTINSMVNYMTNKIVRAAKKPNCQKHKEFPI